MSEKWYDVQDEEGIWRVGFCLSETLDDLKLISLDGFHPNFNSVQGPGYSFIANIRVKW